MKEYEELRIESIPHDSYPVGFIKEQGEIIYAGRVIDQLNPYIYYGTIRGSEMRDVIIDSSENHKKAYRFIDRGVKTQRELYLILYVGVDLHYVLFSPSEGKNSLCSFIRKKDVGVCECIEDHGLWCLFGKDGNPHLCRLCTKEATKTKDGRFDSSSFTVYTYLPVCNKSYGNTYSIQDNPFLIIAVKDNNTKNVVVIPDDSYKSLLNKDHTWSYEKVKELFES